MNKNYKDNKIIVALATPFGKSAVAIIRISGRGCIELAGKYLQKPPEIGKLKFDTFKSGEFVEHLMAVAFKAPRSYTGEDVVELYPHGNMAVCESIISALTSGGARLAERGEFTKRAFLNGKLDLMQCEALADIIDAQTAEQLTYGNMRYDREYKSLYEVERALNSALGEVEAILHYGDELEGEDLEYTVSESVKTAVNECLSKLEKEKAGFDGGKIVNDGFKVALLGRPNVGKSTILNALTESDRAIVTPIAGTTRDTIDGEFVYKGRKFVVTDTAGMNESSTDAVEKIGMERAIAAANKADAVLYIITQEEKELVDGIKANRFAVVCNKRDETEDFGTEYEKAETGGILQISAKFDKNITALKQKLFDMCPKDHGAICNHRQYDCVLKCIDSLKAAKKESEKAEGLEIVAALLYEAYSAILELYGEKADEKIISSVFERFCVGK